MNYFIFKKNNTYFKSGWHLGLSEASTRPKG